ncbi:cysteine-rich motor neuron 1 protein-like [Acipenser oxyrinchus oxyrinchus]|uniref:Cysteine-rich motor neuron 1 protein-like n=1 Tax=Acipenser oxyrinchus oxyrinchus TaxID=40147 RepID=A0AAD8FVI4_ACIOX|nr:cysteine-rich motor neuron 1 protein-like [Acipenser oxyrinchus oxyrinchus]
MYSKYLRIAFLNLTFLVRVLMAYECTPCELRTCVKNPSSTCEADRTLTRDPCGCCDYCTRLEWEPCGGMNWEAGYCGVGLSCATVNGTGRVTIPDVGVCKVLPSNPNAGVEDEDCPEMSGCNRKAGLCSCDTRHTCIYAFSYSNLESCIRATGSEDQHQEKDPGIKYPGVSGSAACVFSGCNLTDRGCVCESQSCHDNFSYLNNNECQMAKDQLKCAGVTCPKQPILDCPKGSVLSKTYTPPAACCPSVPAFCTCNFRLCEERECSHGYQPVLVMEGKGIPGECCDEYECQRVSPKCVHNEQEYAEGQVYRMDTCWLCQCRGGISFCSKAECAELECESFYIPEGECCPVCKDTGLFFLGSSGASCWVNNKLRHHEEQWKEDDCTFCQCVDGDPHCTAMACKQTCQNPVKIHGECCPFCEEPTYETVSPITCPKLKNCTLSEKDCPYGFMQDKTGCLLCKCLTNESCPDLDMYCSLQCPFGYKTDDYGCPVCECTSQIPKCRPMSCSKTCPYGYVRNKHGCEMCRCVKCPPFTCDKECREGYQQNKKGCSICLCKETKHVPSTSLPAPKANYCVTASGDGYEEGESWHDGCRDCFCQAAREMCVLITCPVPSCLHPVVRTGQCCPSCEDESGSGQQPDAVDLAVCKAPGGEFYVEGETWQLDECTYCTCRKGRVLCDTEVCPPVLCQTPVKSMDTCCNTCPDDHFKPLLPVNSSQPEYCISSEGEILLAGESWKANPCTSCTCNNGTIQCFSQSCPPAFCRVPVLRKGQCCPYCLDGTAVLPTLLSTLTPSVKTYPEDTEQWLSTTEIPHIISITEGKIQNEDYPRQKEVALIYQSAAWILAGILLTTVIFLIAALVINKKKKWVQMPCYSAPKKTVILKKHVNKNSVVYMEPSKENSFRNVRNECRVNVPTEASSISNEKYSDQAEKQQQQQQSRLLG